MVGRLARTDTNHFPVRRGEPRKSDLTQSSVPYDLSSNPPIFLSEATTTHTKIVSTTTATTHFFSLPLWKKREFVPFNSTPHTVGIDEHGAILSSTPSSTLMTERYLPPTPPDEESDGPIASGSRWCQTLTDEPRARSLSPTSFFPVDTPMWHRPREPQSTIHSTAALARASLGLGLPHILPHASATSSSSEVNTVSFTPQGSSLQESSRRVRKAKSAQKLKATVPSDRPPHVDFEGDRKRIRGLSLGASSFLNFSTTDMAGNDKDMSLDQPLPSTRTISKTLTRRASFWSRKKTLLVETNKSLAPPDLPKLQLTSLPALPPISPFNADIYLTPSSPSPDSRLEPLHSRGITRSLSARARSTSPPISEASSSTRRPFTADNSVSYFSTKSPPFPESPTLDHPPAPFSRGQKPQTLTEKTTLKPRIRAYTNPPIISRLSLNRLSTSSSISSPHPRHSNTSRIPTGSSRVRSEVSQPIMHSSSPASSSRPSLNKNSFSPIPGEESPEVYLKRLQATVNKSEITGILASSTDALHVQALRTYINHFDFVADPLDVALRKLLMEVGLPRETQQIDRVMEAFAGRYLQCNPTLFTTEDHPYILAFSLIMLHTDTFNKSNKRKMTKADYIKNTRLPDVAPEVLDCFYDNITFAPFIFIEDSLDIDERGSSLSGSIASFSSNTAGTPTHNGGTLKRAGKVDPYYLITNHLLGPLRVDIETYIPGENPYSYEGTAGPWDEAALRRTFAKAREIEVNVPDPNRSSPFFGRGTGSSPVTPVNSPTSTPSTPSIGYLCKLKVMKIGFLNRKDDVLEGGKKASSRKWKSWSVILTGSQLFFFHDPTWASSLLTSQMPADGHIIFPQPAIFKPDELLPIKDAVAVIDRSYTKYDHTFRFALADGRQLLLQAPDEKQLNEWIARINYASTFKSTGVRMRSLDMSGSDVRLTGVAAATSHLHDLQHSPLSRIRDFDISRNSLEPLQRSSDEGVCDTDRVETDIGVPIAPEIDGAEQLKATFDQVKAILASESRASEDRHQPQAEYPNRTSPFPAAPYENSTPPPRSQILQSKVEDLDLRITAAQSQLDPSMRFARNIATLTPFQKTTRERLIIAVQGAAQRIAQVRLEITKLLCYRHVLLTDIASEARSWHQAKTIALRAAKETLETRDDLSSIPSSFHTGPSEIAFPKTEKPHPGLPHGPEPSICESFYSAIDFDFDWPPIVDTSSAFLGTYHSAYPQNLSKEDVNLRRNSDQTLDLRSPSDEISPLKGSLQSHERFYTAHENLEDESEDGKQILSFGTSHQ